MSKFNIEDDFSPEVGICLKDAEKKVLFQNEPCIQACGEKNGTICEKSCMSGYSPQGSLPGLAEGAQVRSVRKSSGESFDAVIMNDGKKILTMLFPLNGKIELGIEFAKAHGVSKRELEVFHLVLGGFSNSKISQKLRITQATLKTHLNNVYKKLPEDSIQELKNRRRKARRFRSPP